MEPAFSGLPRRDKMLRRFLIGATSALMVAGFSTASAEAQVTRGGGDVPHVSDAEMGHVSVRRGVQGPKGLLTLHLLALVNASKDTFGQPTSLAPDIHYSITDTIQIGLLHTGPMGWQSLPGVGLCVTGSGDGKCPNVYNNVGFDFLYGLLYGDFHLSLHSSLFLLPISNPTTGVMWTIGAAGKVHFTDAVALHFDPQIGVMLSNRDDHNDQLFLPLELQFQTSDQISLKLLTGITGQLSDFGDNYRIPLGVGVLANVSPTIDLGLRFSFDNLLGKTAMGMSRSDMRSIGLMMIVRL